MSVGNVTWGGSGKTPMVEHLAQACLSQGRAPVILTRVRCRHMHAKPLCTTNLVTACVKHPSAYASKGHLQHSLSTAPSQTSVTGWFFGGCTLRGGKRSLAFAITHKLFLFQENSFPKVSCKQVNFPHTAPFSVRFPMAFHVYKLPKIAS